MNPPNFNRVARIYRWAEYAALGPLLQRVRTYFVPALVSARQTLVLGDGDGRFLHALLHSNAHTDATAIDGSRTMLRLLEQRNAFAASRLRTQEADLRHFEPSSDSDLVVTHFVLDCFAQGDVDALIRRVAKHTTPHACWVVSDFGLPRTPIARCAATLYISALYMTFRVLTGLQTRALPHHAEALRSTGFERIERKEWMGGFLFTELWQRR